MDKVLCIGAAHVDRKAKAINDVKLGTSIPVSVSQSHGGVARNVAENLARLGCPVTLFSRVGNDAEGTAILSECQSLGIDKRMISLSKTSATASYTALIDPKGDMVVGLANMDIYEELMPTILKPFLPEMQKYPLWFLDTNLPTESLRYLLESCNRTNTVFVDPVSVTKSKKLLSLLSHIDYLFPSRDEAEELSGIIIHTLKDAEKAGKKLCQLGVHHVVITLGAEGVWVIDSTNSLHFPALEVQTICDVTGAGDALIAGVLFGISSSLSLNDSIHYGIAAATLAIETNHTVNPFLNQKLLNEKMKEVESCQKPILQ